MLLAALFVLGFSTAFVLLGASNSLVGELIHAWSAQLSIVAGIVIIVMGLHFLGLIRIGRLMREGRLSIPKPVGLWGDFVDDDTPSYRKKVADQLEKMPIELGNKHKFDFTLPSRRRWE